MNVQYTKKTYKADAKPEALTSMGLAIMGILTDVVIITAYSGTNFYAYGIRDILVFTSVKWGWLFNVIGLTLGILGMKSSAKKFAISGIAVSAVTLPINLLAAMVARSFREIFPFMFIHYPLF